MQFCNDAQVAGFFDEAQAMRALHSKLADDSKLTKPTSTSSCLLPSRVWEETLTLLVSDTAIHIS